MCTSEADTPRWSFSLHSYFVNWDYAASKGYGVAAVLTDDITGGSDFMKRPGMVRLLTFLDAHSRENLVVIFDELKLYARDTVFHLKLRLEIAALASWPDTEISPRQWVAMPKTPKGGRVLVHDVSVADVVREALEGFVGLSGPRIPRLRRRAARPLRDPS